MCACMHVCQSLRLEALRMLLAIGCVCLLFGVKSCLDQPRGLSVQIRAIVTGNHLSYRTLVSSPSTLLAASRHFASTEHGALLTRFTVQFNLYAGSVVALGSDEQREELFATQVRVAWPSRSAWWRLPLAWRQNVCSCLVWVVLCLSTIANGCLPVSRQQSAGDLGCFAFTESGAGVMSGAGVETTATFDAERQVFVINSPTISSRKNWISQVRACGCMYVCMCACMHVFACMRVLPKSQDTSCLMFMTVCAARPPPTRVCTLSAP